MMESLRQDNSNLKEGLDQQVESVRNNTSDLRENQRFRGGLVFKAHRLCVSLNSRLESNKK